MYANKENNFEYVLDKEESEKSGGIVLKRKSKFKEYRFEKKIINKDIIFKIIPNDK